MSCMKRFLEDVAEQLGLDLTDPKQMQETLDFAQGLLETTDDLVKEKLEKQCGMSR